MSAHRCALVVAVAAYLTFAATAAAGTTSISGTVPNGGCDANRPVPVSGASRIEVTVSSTSSENNSIFAEIVAPNGAVVATGQYDTPSGGSYAVRVCSQWAGMDPPTIQYNGLIGTGPAGQPALPRQSADQGGVKGAFTSLSHSVTGKGAIATRSGLAWFTVDAASNGGVTLRIYDPVHHQHLSLAQGMHVVFGSNIVRITGHGLTLVLVDQGPNQRITFSSRRLKAGGKVVRGRFEISA